MSRENKINRGRLVFGVLSFVASAVLAVLAQPLVRANPSAVEMIATVFSILAGFLIAVISIISNTVELRLRYWKQDYLNARAIKRRLYRQELTFYLYLLVLAAVFAVMLSGKLPDPARELVEVALLFLASWAFLLSFRLPRELTARQMEKLDEAIEKWHRNPPSAK